MKNLLLDLPEPSGLAVLDDASRPTDGGYFSGRIVWAEPSCFSSTFVPLSNE
jgi:hypothetical protein